MKSTPLSSSLSGSLSSFSSLEIVDLLHTSRRSGQLKVRCDTTEKSVFFEEGEIIFATSNQLQDRLGESLVRSGRITPEQFEKACEIIKPGMRLGKLLVDQGFINPENLWIGVKNQVEEIFYSILRMNRGEFFFAEGAPHTENTVRLSRSVHALIFEGVRQADDLRIFVEKIINQKTVFLPLNLAPDFQLTDVENEIYGLIDGRKTVRKILAESSTSAFVTLKVLSNLMLAHVIIPKDSGAIKDKDVSSTVEQGESVPLEDPVSKLLEIIQVYGKILSEIHKTLLDHGLILSDDLRVYLETLEEPQSLVLRDFSWEKEGGMSENLILNNLQRVPSHQRDELLARVFEDLLSYLLFKTQSALPKDVFQSLFAITQEILRDGLYQKESR